MELANDNVCVGEQMRYIHREGVHFGISRRLRDRLCPPSLPTVEC